MYILNTDPIFQAHATRPSIFCIKDFFFLFTAVVKYHLTTDLINIWPGSCFLHPFFCVFFRCEVIFSVRSRVFWWCTLGSADFILHLFVGHLCFRVRMSIEAGNRRCLASFSIHIKSNEKSSAFSDAKTVQSLSICLASY